jgi:XTP/dITP diphosphohydrolase
MKLVFASNNEHKIAEIAKLVPAGFQVVSLASIGCTDDIPETAETLEGNAILKAQYVWERFGLSCFADDTGLEVHALGNAPGVYSARYAGSQRNAADNMKKLLNELNEINQRDARFRTVIALILDGQLHTFEGIVNGTITREQHGAEGFGYDPIFKPEGFEQTFAQMTMDQKNTMSHRGRAVQKLVHFLENFR